MEKSAKLKPLSIVTGVLFLLAAILSLVTTISTAAEADYAAGKAVAVDMDYFYDHADLRSNGDYYNPYTGSYRYNYDYYYEGYYYDDYSDYLDTVEGWEWNYNSLKSVISLSVVLTVVFVLSAVGVFIAKPKEFSWLFIIAQIGYFIATTIVLSTDYLWSKRTIFILIFAVLSLICTAYYIINKIKHNTVFAIIFAIPMLINSGLFIFPAVASALMISNGPVSIPLALTCVPGVIALWLSYIGVFAKRKERSESTTEVPSITFEVPTQPVIYDIQPVAYEAPVQPIATPKPSKPATSSRSTSSADELKKYKELLDMGAITQEEFDAKKKQLLDL